jgi:esterase/lipase
MSVGEPTRQQIINDVDSLLHILKAEPDIAMARMKMEDFMTRAQRRASDDQKKVADRMGGSDKLIEGFLDPKFIYRLHHDPKLTFRKVRIPVLVIFGDADASMDVNTNYSLVEEAFDSTYHEIRFFSGVGHLLMKSEGVRMEKLHEIQETIAPEVLDNVGDWILLRARE